MRDNDQTIRKGKSRDKTTSEICQQLETVTTQIEEGLSKLPLRGPQTLTPPKDPDLNRPVFLLEVYCFEGSQLTSQMSRFGGAIRFTKRDGDLSTPEGIDKLMTWVKLYEPTHIWAALDCKAWGGFSRLNMSRDPEIRQRILGERERGFI